MRARLHLVAAAVATVTMACGGDDNADTSSTTTASGTTVAATSPTPAPTTALAPSTSATTTVAPTTIAATTTTSKPTTTTISTTTTTTPPPTTTLGPPLVTGDGSFQINWTSLQAKPFYDPDAGSAADPFFFIHTIPKTDGFFFSLEMYTTGYGAQWTGQLGSFELGCSEPSPAPNSTGLCVHFDPDGPGPIKDLNAGFDAVGTLDIQQLDASGYRVAVGDITFSNGDVLEGFLMEGTV